jgi:hypothetical protein
MVPVIVPRSLCAKTVVAHMNRLTATDLKRM